MSSIFVGNLTLRTTEADICALFELYGEVQSVALVKDALSGNSCGFAFVHMPNPTDAQDAIVCEPLHSWRTQLESEGSEKAPRSWSFVIRISSRQASTWLNARA